MNDWAGRGWCQRWLPGGQAAWIHAAAARPRFDPGRYGVTVIGEAAAREFIGRHHYARTMPAAVHRYGLFDLAAAGRPALVGVTVLSVPAQRKVLTGAFPELAPYRESLDVGRTVLTDLVPPPAESWFFGQVRRLAALAGVRGLVMFADPVPRRRADGSYVLPGHVGAQYQASGCRYTGQGTPRTQWLLPTGEVLSPRAMQKIRAREQGHDYAERQLVAAGARPPQAGERPATWLAGALAAAQARRIRHPGCHRYVIALGTTRRERAAVVIALPARPYPKKNLGQLELFGEDT